MLVTKKSPMTGKDNTLDLDITPEQLAEIETRGRARLIQEIVPHLSDAEREFLLTGYTQEDWNAMFPPEEEEE